MAIPQFKTQRAELLLILFIFILALTLRLAYFKDYLNTYAYPVLSYSDGYSYYIWAKDIASGDLLGNKAFMKWPFYAYFLAFLFKIFGENIALVYMFQFILGAISCVLTYLIAKIMFNRAVGVIAAVLFASYGMFIFYEGLLMYAGLSLFFNLLLFLFFLRLQASDRKVNFFLAGILLGVCTITQGNIIIFGILALLLILSKQKLKPKKLIYNFLVFFTGLLLVIGLVTLRNYIAEKDFVLISGNLGIAFYCGNNPESDGIFSYPLYITPNQDSMFRDTRIIAKLSLGKEPKTSEVSRFWFNKSIDFIKNRPLDYFKLLLKKIIYLYSPREFVHDWEFSLIKNNIGIFKVVFLDLRLIMPFVLLGMILGLARIKENALLYLILAALTFSVTLFFVAAKYRIAIVPYFIIFSSLGIYEILKAGWQKNFRKAGELCIVVVIISLTSVLANIFIGTFDKQKDRYAANKRHDFLSHLESAMEYKDRSIYAAALKEAETAYAIDQGNPIAIFTLGELEYRMNNLIDAEKRFKEVIERFPFYVDAYYNLGLLYNQKQRFLEARELLEQAIFLDPEDAGAHFELGRVYKALGEFGLSKREFGLALNKISRWRTNDRRMIKKELMDFD